MSYIPSQAWHHQWRNPRRQMLVDKANRAQNSTVLSQAIREASEQMKTQAISIPAHPDDYDVPVSLVHIPLSKGKYATLCGPLGRKTLTALQGTIESCKDALIAKPEDYEI